jgi:thymidine phosphorylase
VGAVMRAKVGDEVRAGEPLVTLHHRGGRGLEAAMATLAGAASLGERGERRPLVLEILR